MSEGTNDILKLVDAFEKAFNEKAQLFLEQTSYESLIEYYQDQREFEKALGAIDYALEQYPYTAVFFVRKAQVFIERKMYDEALDLLDHAETFDPGEIGVAIARADAHTCLGHHDKAIDILESKLEQVAHEERWELLLELADVYEDAEKYDNVMDSLKQALSSNPESEEALNRLWFCVELNENYEDSVQFHSTFIEEHPYSYLGWYNLAHAYEGLGLTEKAVEAYEFVHAINEAYHPALTDCAELHFGQAAYQKAVDLYLTAVDYTEPRKEIFFNIGVCFEYLSQPTKARYYYRKSIALYPQYDEAFFRIGESYKQQKLWENAASAFERALKIAEKNTEYLKSLTDCYIQLEQHEKALQIYPVLLEEASDDKSNWINFALTLFEVGKAKDALSLLGEAKNIFDNHYEVLYLLCALHHHQGNKKQSLEYLELALSTSYEKVNRLFEINAELVADPDIQQLIDQYKPE